MICRDIGILLPDKYSFMQKITGIGGIFLKAQNPPALTEWYKEHLGIEFSHGMHIFAWENPAPPAEPGQTVFSFFKADSSYFQPSEKPFMINFRVSDLSALFQELKAKGVTIAGEIEEHEYGKFAWIVDLEGNKIELWEPV